MKTGTWVYKNQKVLFAVTRGSVGTIVGWKGKGVETDIIGGAMYHADEVLCGADFPDDMGTGLYVWEGSYAPSVWGTQYGGHPYEYDVGIDGQVRPAITGDLRDCGVELASHAVSPKEYRQGIMIFRDAEHEVWIAATSYQEGLELYREEVHEIEEDKFMLASESERQQVLWGYGELLHENTPTSIMEEMVEEGAEPPFIIHHPDARLDHE